MGEANRVDVIVIVIVVVGILGLLFLLSSLYILEDRRDQQVSLGWKNPEGYKR